MSKALPNAGKPGKRRKGDDKKSGDSKRGGNVPYELDPKAVKSYQANCPDCGSLGLYLDPGDAAAAERSHQQMKHSNSPSKRTISDTAQQKRNKEGGKGGGKK